MVPHTTSPGPRRGHPRRPWIAAALALALVAAACSGSHGSSSATTGSTAADGSATTVAGATTTPATAAKFGTLDSPCGKGTAKGATDKGVTDTTITIGYGDDAGYAAAPGLDKEMSDAMKPFIKWCNDQGGINGRKVVGNYYDGKVTQVTQAITQACNDKVFMLVGQGWVLDSGAETTRIGCKLSSIPGYTVATAAAHGPGVVQPIPNPGDQVTTSAAYQIDKLFPAAVKKAAFVFAEYPATRETRDKAAAGFPKAGWTFQSCDQIYNISGESDWKPFASNLKSCGIQAVVWIGSPNPNFENLLTAAKQVGFHPAVWYSDPNQYDASFAKWNGQNGGAGDQVYVRMAAVPFELADQVPAVKQYMDLVTNSGGAPALLGMQSASAFLLWATGVKACGSNVTAGCVLQQVSTETNWTAGGLHAPTDPGSNTGTDCGLVMHLTGTTWTKVAPVNGVFDCQSKYLVKGITTAAVTAAKLNGQRVSTEYGTYTP